MTLYIGADPEFFVRKGQHFISGHIFPCGTKHKPRRTDNGFVQVDGVALECNIRPSDNRSAFISNLRGVLRDLDSIVRSVDASAELVARPAVFFGQKRLSTIPPENAELGCTPDFDAYTGRRNPTPDRTIPIRTGSGHIHIGWTEGKTPREFKHFQRCCGLSKQLDYFLGLPSLLWDTDTRRRQLYGQAGAFRPKPYGVEYRVLSNAWITTDKQIGWVYDQTVKAVESFNAGDELDLEFEGVARQVINSGNTNWRKEYPSIAERVL